MNDDLEATGTPDQESPQMERGHPHPIEAEQQRSYIETFCVPRPPREFSRLGEDLAELNKLLQKTHPIERNVFFTYEGLHRLCETGGTLLIYRHQGRILGMVARMNCHDGRAPFGIICHLAVESSQSQEVEASLLQHIVDASKNAGLAWLQIEAEGMGHSGKLYRDTGFLWSAGNSVYTLKP